MYIKLYNLLLNLDLVVTKRTLVVEFFRKILIRQLFRRNFGLSLIEFFSFGFKFYSFSYLLPVF